MRIFSLILLAMIGLTSCTTTTTTIGSDGKPLPKVYRIRAAQESKIQYGMLDSVNALRAAAGASAVSLNSSLNAAAETHARDMNQQNRPWHFGSDGSSPIDRAARAGYRGLMIGETISETFETEVETLAAWMAQPDTRDIILDKRATDLGFEWFQDTSGKLWWVLLIGSSKSADTSAFVSG